jgi:hypothetical protein
MPIKDSHVRTDVLNYLGEFDSVPVRFTDELKETSIYDLAFSSSTASYLPDLFMGYFTGEGEKANKWYIGNAIRHKEMTEAIIEFLGQDHEYYLGQARFDKELLDTGKLVFDEIHIDADLPEPKKTLETLFGSINPDYLADKVTILSTDRFLSFWYDKESGNVFKKISKPQT